MVLFDVFFCNLVCRAEDGDFSEVQRVLQRLQEPFTEKEGEPLEKAPVRQSSGRWSALLDVNRFPMSFLAACAGLGLQSRRVVLVMKQNVIFFSFFFHTSS